MINAIPKCFQKRVRMDIRVPRLPETGKHFPGVNFPHPPTGSSFSECTVRFKALLERGDVDVGVKDVDGQTALEVAYPRHRDAIAAMRWRMSTRSCTGSTRSWNNGSATARRNGCGFTTAGRTEREPPSYSGAAIGPANSAGSSGVANQLTRQSRWAPVHDPC